MLGSARLLVDSLAKARLKVGLSWRNLAHALDEPADARNWGVLYLGSAQTRAIAMDGEPLIALKAPLFPIVKPKTAFAVGSAM